MKLTVDRTLALGQEGETAKKKEYHEPLSLFLGRITLPAG
jgi:hypothetical protein